MYVGVRVLEVVDERRELDGRTGHVWGWRYGTLEGHVEQGEMSWEVWKWHDSGEVEFRVHAISREAPIRDPLHPGWLPPVRPPRTAGVPAQHAGADAAVPGLAVAHGDEGPVRKAAKEMTARPLLDSEPHDQLASNVSEPLSGRR